MQTFEAILAAYKAPELIPDEALYAYISDAAVRQKLAEAGAAQIKESVLGKEVVRRSKSDLYWLAKYFLWETNPEGSDKPIEKNKFNKRVHGRLCELFVKKDCTKSIEEQDWRKERVFLCPRGTFKSTADICDAVQWILNFPEIRILILTAADDLATGFVDEIKGHFVVRFGRASLMNLFFPEYCVDETSLGPAGEFTCPLWGAKKIKRKEPTVMSSSVVSTLSGYHFDVIKADDTVSNKNSENPVQCKKVTDNFYINVKMLMPYGYLDIIGTRYAEEDMYGDKLQKLQELEAQGQVTRTSGPCWEIVENQITGARILITRAIVIKPEVKERLEKEGKEVTYMNAGVEGCDLLFPEHQPFPWLMKEFADNEKAFEGQLNQNPRPFSFTTFDEALLKKHTIPYNELPMRPTAVTQTWDFAFSKKKGRDYSTGSTVVWDERAKMYVVDLVRQRFKPLALAQAVVDFAVKWRPQTIGIENASGSQLLEPTIIALAVKTGIPEVIAVCSRIDWFTPDNQNDAKKIRMAALHPWLVQDNMWFASYLPYLQVLYEEFQKCLNTHHHDDIPDVLSQQPRYVPRVTAPPKSAGELKNPPTPFPNSREQAAWNLTFEENCDPFGRPGLGTPPPPIVVTEPEPETKPEAPPGLDPILGAGVYG